MICKPDQLLHFKNITCNTPLPYHKPANYSACLHVY